MNIQLSIIIPDLLIKIQGQALPGLAKLLARATKTSIEAMTFEQRLLQLFGLAEFKPPIAALTALGDGLEVKPSEWWLRADPVELQADQATVYLVGSEHLSLSHAETRSLLIELNKLLQLENLHLQAADPQRWYLRLLTDPEIITTSPASLQAQTLKYYTVKGARQTYWRQLETELQMILYNSEVNQQRQLNGKPLVNGIWLWGEGQLLVISQKAAWQKIWSNELVAAGLALQQKISVSKVPPDLAACLTAMQAEGNYLLAMEPAQTKNLAQLETAWFRPLLKALKTGCLTQLTFYLADHLLFTLTAADSKKWWRSRYNF